MWSNLRGVSEKAQEALEQMSYENRRQTRGGFPLFLEYSSGEIDRGSTTSPSENGGPTSKQDKRRGETDAFPGSTSGRHRWTLDKQRICFL